ncbi:MAG: hypothetical protein F4169_19985 [Gammaproteobacteria bacterium]|nr:hypothetical protein [Gammaproteobacteria bacterium]MYI05932.1 hypothetical protein [Gemmatimonadota bacterium]
MLRPRVRWSLLVTALLLNACVGPKSEGAKFRQMFLERGSWEGFSEELEKYPLEQQYEIFLYGMQKVHPPDSKAADTIAKRGKPAMDYVLRMVAASGKDMDYVDSLEIFEAMVRGRHYLVCADIEAMEQIEANGNKIAHEDWRKYYQRDLQRLKELCVRKR